MDTLGKWYFEQVTPDLMMLYRIKGIVYSGETQYQTVEILDTHAFGRSLVLDGRTQSSTADEALYHECLVHPALLYHPNPESVFIGGGGEGATLREVLRHKAVKRVVMVDLDKEVVDLCKEFLPEHSLGGFGDPRLELVHGDAREYLKSAGESFDAMVLDLVDPLEGGPSYLLYTQEFYRIAASALKSGGALVTQAGPAGPLNYQEHYSASSHTMASVFMKSYPYTVFIPAFTTEWGFVLAINGAATSEPSTVEPETLDRLIAKRLPEELKHYDGMTHRKMFSLPKYLREGIAAEDRTITDESPAFML